MFGNRGVGKTSIANVLNSFFENLLISKITCNRNDDFKSLWLKVLNRINFIISKKGIGFTPNTEEKMIGLDIPNEDEIDPTAIEEVFYDVPNFVLIIFDEFDSITDKNTKKMLADTLKILSDNNPNITVLIVGVAENVNDLIGEHSSLERCLKQIKVPAMSKKDTEILIVNSLKALNIEISNAIKDKIIEYSTGFPHYTHLLCKNIALKVIKDNSNKITNKHFDFAVLESIKNSDHSIQEAYKKAVSSTKQKNQFENVIFASILAEKNNKKIFTPEEVLLKYNKLTKKQVKKESLYYNLGMLCKPERGLILIKKGSVRNRKYEFRNPLMKAFVKLKLHKKN